MLRLCPMSCLFRKLNKGHLSHLLLPAVVIFAAAFIFNQTRLRVAKPVNKPVSSNIAGSQKEIIDKNEGERKIGTLATKNEAPNPDTQPIIVKDPWKEARNYVDQSQHPVFSAFNDWISEYERVNCSTPVDCREHDPRYLRTLMLRGERLSRTRASKLLEIIRGDPEMAIKMAIPEQTAVKLPPAIKKNLEQWESAFADIKTAHSCFSPDHKGCEIRRAAKFKDNRQVRLWTFGKRSGIDTINNLAVWGVTLGDDFAMADTPLREIHKSGNSGLAQLGGNRLSYNTKAELNYFSYLLKDAERRVGSTNGVKTVDYPAVMGSSNSMGAVLRARYQIVSTPQPFMVAYEDAISKGGTLLKIESQEENDFICELLEANVLKGRDDENNGAFVPWVWLGATDDENQSGIIYDRAENTMKDINISAEEMTWKWLDGQPVDETYFNFTGGFPVDPDVVDPFANHAFLNYTNGEWGSTWGPFPAGPRDAIHKIQHSSGTIYEVTKIASPDLSVLFDNPPFPPDLKIIFQAEGSYLPYVIEYHQRADHGRSQDISLKGIRKVLVIPGRYETETERFLSSYAFSTNHLNTNGLGEPIDPEISKQTFTPISTEKLQESMEEVKEFFYNTTDQELELVPVFAPTVTIPVNISTSVTEFAGSASNHDSNGTHTGGAVYIFSPYADLASFAEQAKNIAAQESEEYDFYGPAFVGIASIEVNTASGFTGDPNGYEEPPKITLSGGAFINPVTGLPHVRHEPAQLEAVLDEQGRISKIKITEPGSYYFDPEFGSTYDSFGRSIFDYNYKEDDLKPAEDRSPLHSLYRDLCVILDSDDDGVAENSSIQPTISIDGDNSFTNDFSIQVDNVCITWIVLTNYQFGAEYDGESDTGDGVAEYNASASPGTAWVGAPGAHISITTDSDGERGASSRTIAHEIGHNLGLWHDQSFISKGEHALSDESIQVEYGNPFPIMGSGDIALGAHFSLPAQTTLFEIFNGGAGFSSGISKSTMPVDVLDISDSSDLSLTDFNEPASPNPNTFRIYRNNFYSPPRSLRESNFTVRFPEDMEDNISWFVNELLGEPNGTKSAHENNSTASDLDLNISITVLGSGEDANITLSFSKQSLPRMEIHDGGRGFYEDPRLVIEDINSSTTLIIDPSWITEENSLRVAKILDSNESAIWLRGIRIATDAGGGGNFLPRGSSVDDNLSEYYLSYRTDSSLYGINLLLANDPRGQFLPDRETFLVDCTPNTPQDFNDAALLVGSTYSDYDSDIHITPVGWGGGAPLSEIGDIQAKILEVTEKRNSLTDILGEEGSIFYQEYQDELTELRKVQENLESGYYPYMEVVINIGTMGDGSAQAPQFDLFIENEFPKVGEFVQFAAIPMVGDSSNFAYTWYINEQRLEEPGQLNQPANFLAFNQPGRRVIRVVVSDMKGGVSSKTKVIQVTGEEIIHNDSLVSGTVRSAQGAIQGARVVIEEAPIYEHSLNVEGVLRDSYFTTGLNNPLELRIDNEISPTLEFHRGEIHRFYFSEYFDQALDFSKFVFLEQPEGSPPRVSINLISDPHRSKTKFGGLYVRNPEIIYEMNTSFNPYFSSKVAPFHELTNPHNKLGSGSPAPSINETTVISRPYAKALMEESNISIGRVGPMEINEFGYYVYGGKAYSRDNSPVMQVRRVSIWEDYDNNNATAQANIDGVGTISPINSVDPITGLSEFLGQTWRTRSEDDELPEIIVWGSGGDETEEEPIREVNTTIVKGKETNRYITISNQGQGYEPDGTMAVLHYPVEPYAYWSFDRHESLFENNLSGRYQPSPVWNRQFFFNDLLHRWTFDEANGTVIANVDKDLNFTVPFSTGLVSDWGLKGRALDWNATVAVSQDITFLSALPDDNVTVSFWARPDSDFNVTLGNNDVSLNFDFDLNETIFKRNVGDLNPIQLVRANPQFNRWVHFAVTTNRRAEELSLYVDGRMEFIEEDINLTGDITISHFDGLIDEFLIFDKALEEPAVKYLAGRTYLDLSGNKFHLSPMSENLVPVTPGQFGSSPDVPSDFSLLPEAQAASTPEGRIGKLGDTFIQENSGHSLGLNGSTDYLDLSSHKDEFALDQGTISLWVKTPQFYNENLPLLWLSKPFSFTDVNVTDPVSGNSTIVREFDPGQYFALDILNGWPRIAGYQVLGSANKINLTGEWKHLAATFPEGKFWIDGEEVPSGLYDSAGNIFDSMTNPLEFMSEADTFWIGKALDVDDDTIRHHYSGGIDDFAVYNRILTDEEVYFLYELRRGREQIPRLEAIVDAVGTVDILDQGEGYRENPKLVFGFGDEMDKTNLLIQENDLELLKQNHTENNTKHGDLALVLNNAQGDPINSVYSFHMGADPASNLTYQSEWRKSGTANGWRRLVPAQGIGEYENAALGDVVWTKRLSTQTEIPLPDGNTSLRRYVEYVTDQIHLSSFSEVNQTSPAHRGYWKPNGLYGFAQVPNLKVASPGLHNSEITEEESEFFTAEAYVLYQVDQDANESVTIVDAGSGFKEDAQSQFNNGSLNVKISGKGYRPPRIVQEHKGRGASTTTLQGEQWEDPLEPLDDADAAISAIKTVSAGPGYSAYDWVGTHDLGISFMEFNQSLANVYIDDPGYGYSTPIELRSWGGYPELGHSPLTGSMIESVFFDLGTDTLFYFEETLGVGLEFDPTDPTTIVQPIAYEEAVFIVTEVDENGSITKIEMTDPGEGYRRWWDNNVFLKGSQPSQIFPSEYFIDTDGTLMVTGRAADGTPNQTGPALGYVSVKGGGGIGAEIWITGLTPTGEVDGSSTNPDIIIVEGGRGYFNIDPDNFPEANITRAGVGEVNATVITQLGGYLESIPHCRGCPKEKNPVEEKHEHIAPWIEIWDRGRSESIIDDLGVRALATAKVVNGKIEKVVVVDGGSGYIDPIAYVRDVPPKHVAAYYIGQVDGNDTWARVWRCTNLRVNLDGEEEMCGHMHWGKYPPEECPGETDADFPYEDENGTITTTGEKVEQWQERHDLPYYHDYCVGRSGVPGEDHNNSTHLTARFLSRKCWGTKENYKLLDPAYRRSTASWSSLEANVSITAKNGRITEIKVENQGDNYFAPSLLVEGSGSGVDAIPVYNERAKMTSVIFDDPRLKNIQLDTHIKRPLGAGQGFRERPWSWDETYDARGFPREKIKILTKSGGALSTHNADGGWLFGDPKLKDNLGDRILSVEVNSSGIYANTTNLEPAFIDYNTSVRIAGHGLVDLNGTDFDGDGQSDFFDAQIHGMGDFRLKHFLLDGNGTFQDWTEVDKSLSPRGIFKEQPSVEIWDSRNLSSNSGSLRFPYEEENASSFIRLNTKVGYSPIEEKNFLELYLDDRFPNQIYYGIGQITEEDNFSDVLPKMGGEIRITEGLPGADWSESDPSVKKHFAYTDQNGFYAVGDLEPGMYVVSVFMEDKNYQDMTFRTDANQTRVTHILYVPGFPELKLVSDNFGFGKSTLVWSELSRQLSRPLELQSDLEEYDYEYRVTKTLEGIGRGFDPQGPPPQLVIVPDRKNIGRAKPRLDVNVSVDGSLTLRIIDDENTSTYFPSDSFTIRYSSTLSGVDFYKSYQFSETNETYGAGELASWGAANSSPRLIILPDDGNGSSPVQAPLSNLAYEWNASASEWSEVVRHRPLKLRAEVYEANGTREINPIVDWKLSLEFNASEGNNSLVAQFIDSPLTKLGRGELNASGTDVELYLYSLLRKGSGIIKDLEIIDGGSDYRVDENISIFGQGYGFEGRVKSVTPEGSISEVNITKRGYKYDFSSVVKVSSENGEGALFKPTFYNGSLTIEANYTTQLSDTAVKDKILVTPTMFQNLNKRETWSNLYLDTFYNRDSDWWKEDLDSDSLLNSDEYALGTDPDNNDTDNDGLSDFDETESVLSSNPLAIDTDGDGLSDKEERETSTNPRMKDTDQDGLTDDVDEEPTNPDGSGLLTGRIFQSLKYNENNPKLYYRLATDTNIETTEWNSTWKFMEGFLNKNSLHYDVNYTIQAFLDMDSGRGPKDGIFTPGEPFAEVDHFLSEDYFGIRLTPVDASPNIRLVPGIDLIKTIDFNGTNLTQLEEWGVEANDSFYDPNTFSPELHNPKTDEIELLVKDNLGVDETAKFEMTFLLSTWGGLIDRVRFKHGGADGTSTWQQNGTEWHYIFYDNDNSLEEMVERAPDDSLISLDVNASAGYKLQPDNGDINSSLLTKPNVYGLFGYEYEQYYGGESVSFLVDGNLTPYLLNQLTNTSPNFLEIDHALIPTGLWELNFTAIDEFGNLSETDFDEDISVISRQFVIKDNAPPVITLTHTIERIGATTTSIEDLNQSGSISTEVLNYDLNETNETVFWQWISGDPFMLSDINSEGATPLQLHVWDIKNGLIGDWSVSVEYNDTEPLGREDDINFWKAIFADGNTTDIPFTKDSSGVYSFSSETKIGVYRFEFHASDVADNNTSLFLYLLVDDEYITSEITAIDGYLHNAKVIFDSNGDGVSDLDREFFTDEQGRATISFTQEEFEQFDVNANGVLDPSEGKFIVIGGFDTSTGVYFPGKLIADANSSVISPLTTMIAKLMDEGATKSEALSALSIALQLNSEIDLTSYDPFEKALQGDPLAVKVMEANLRMANLVNQAEGLLLTLSDSYSGYSVGTFLLEEIAKMIRTNEATVLDLESLLVDAIPLALISAGVSGEFSLEDQLAMFQMIAELDQSLHGLELDLSFDELISRQKSVISSMDETFNALENNRSLLPTKQYTLEVHGGEGGEVSEGGKYPYGSKLIISAQPYEGYHFIEWIGDGIEDNYAKSTLVKLTSDINVSAIFAPTQYMVNVYPSAGGTTTGAGHYQLGDQAYVEALAYQGHYFSGWMSDDILLSTQNPLGITVSDHINLRAQFLPLQYSLKLNVESGGMVLGAGNFEHGKITPIQAIPDAGYIFSKWIGEGVLSNGDSSTTVTMSEDRVVEGVFVEVSSDLARVKISANPFSGGTTKGSGSYSIGQAITLHAIPKEGFEFTGWSGISENSSSTDQIVVQISGNMEAVAHFSPQQLLLTLDTTDGGDVYGSGTYSYFDEANISAIPSEGYRFKQWEGQGVKNPFSAVTTALVSEASSIKALFEKKVYTLVVSAKNGGTVLGGGEFEHNTMANISAIAANGFSFESWTGNSIQDASSASTKVLVTDDLRVEANFVGINNQFSPVGEDFELWLDHEDYEIGEILLRVSAQDGDNDPLSLNIESGNPDLDADNLSMFSLTTLGDLQLLDRDEVSIAAGSSIQLLISISDQKGRSSQVNGVITVAPRIILESKNLLNGWFESPWFGTIFATRQNWLYHQPLGWVYLHSTHPQGFWLWDNLKSYWIWTSKDVYPWFYLHNSNNWLYHKLDEGEVKVFDQASNSWNFRK